MKRVMVQSDLTSDDSQSLLATLIEQINKISTQACHKNAS
jgi:hypothetical protein